MTVSKQARGRGKERRCPRRPHAEGPGGGKGGAGGGGGGGDGLSKADEVNGDSPERDRSSPYPLNQDSCERDCAKEEEEEEEEEEGLFKAEEKPC